MRKTALAGVWLASLMLAWAFGYYSARPAAVPVVAASPSLIEAPVTATEAAPEPDITERLRQVAIDEGNAAAAALARRYLRDHPGDVSVTLSLADYLAAIQRFPPIFAMLFELFQSSVNTHERQRIRIAIVDHSVAYEAHLLETLNNTGVARNLLTEHLQAILLADPFYDGHRLRLAYWLIETEAFDDAERLLRETGHAGVTADDIAQAQTTLDLARNKLRVHRDARSLLTEMAFTTRAGPQQVSLLIDTGATMSAIHTDLLRRAGARRLPHRQQVHTANGATQLAVFELQDVVVGNLRLPQLRVLGLEEPPGAAQGLLGMDVITLLPESISTLPEADGR